MQLTWQRTVGPHKRNAGGAPRGRARVARAQEARQVAGRPRGRPCGVPRVRSIEEYKEH